MRTRQHPVVHPGLCDLVSGGDDASCRVRDTNHSGVRDCRANRDDRGHGHGRHGPGSRPRPARGPGVPSPVGPKPARMNRSSRSVPRSRPVRKASSLSLSLLVRSRLASRHAGPGRPRVEFFFLTNFRRTRDGRGPDVARTFCAPSGKGQHADAWRDVWRAKLSAASPLGGPGTSSPERLVNRIHAEIVRRVPRRPRPAARGRANARRRTRSFPGEAGSK